MKSVAIFGAGASGLCMARHLTKCNTGFKPVIYEMTETVGGTWVYSEYPNKEKVHSSMYKSMVTNLPKEVMEFPDFCFNKNLPTFIHHTEVLNYLQQYCSNFNLGRYVQFRHKVTNVTPVKTTGKKNWIDDVKWKVTVKDLTTNKSTSRPFDVILICNGHYSNPYIPRSQGIDFFKGCIMHSHNYRKPTSFLNKNVVIVGAGASGLDIALDIATVANRVYLCHRKAALSSKLPNNIFETPALQEFKEDGSTVTFSNGKEAKDISCVIYCTGYNYSFPFLDAECGIHINQNRITPLFKHIVNICHPSMMFIGVPAQVPPFRVFNLQTLYALEVLTGKFVLPSKSEMVKDANDDFYERLNSGLPKKYAHVMTGRIMQYIDLLSKSANILNIPDNIKEFYTHMLDHRSKHLTSYKTDKYVLNKFGKYEIE